MMTKFELPDNVQPVFKKKQNVFSTSLEQFNEEPDRVFKTEVLSKNSEWVEPMVYRQKKSKEIRVCADFSTGLKILIILFFSLQTYLRI